MSSSSSALDRDPNNSRADKRRQISIPERNGTGGSSADNVRLPSVSDGTGCADDHVDTSHRGRQQQVNRPAAASSPAEAAPPSVGRRRSRTPSGLRTRPHPPFTIHVGPAPRERAATCGPRTTAETPGIGAPASRRQQAVDGPSARSSNSSPLCSSLALFSSPSIRGQQQQPPPPSTKCCLHSSPSFGSSCTCRIPQTQQPCRSSRRSSFARAVEGVSEPKA